MSVKSVRLVLLIAAAIGLIAFITSCGSTKPPYQVTERDYKVYSVDQHKEVGLAEITAAMNNYDVAIFGEEHNDLVGHYLEKTIFEDLHKAYNGNLALSMEMFERDVQGVLNEYVEGIIRDRDLVKDGRAWQNYKDYRPMVDYAKKNKLDVVAANAPGRYASLAGMKGPTALNALSDHAKRYIAPLPYDTATGAYYDMLMDVSAHAMPDAPKKTPAATDTTKNKTATTAAPAKDTAKPKPVAAADSTAKPSGAPSFSIIYGQSLWDATMASSIANYRKAHPERKIFQVNGRFHSDQRFGIVQQLAKYDPSCRVLVISSGSDSAFFTAKYDSLTKNGNFIIVTDPNAPRSYGE